MTKDQKTLAIVGGGALAALLAVLLYEAFKKPADTTLAPPPVGGGTPTKCPPGTIQTANGCYDPNTGSYHPPPPSGGGGPSPGPGPGGGGPSPWTPVTDLQPGKLMIISADIRGALQSSGIQIFTDHDALPSNWPSQDVSAGRWRAMGPSSGAATIPPEYFSKYGLQLYQFGNPKFNPPSWMPVTSIASGFTYAASAPMRDVFHSAGFTLYDEHDALAPDWPASDTGSRWRIEGVWPTSTNPLAALLAVAIASGIGSPRMYVHT